MKITVTTPTGNIGKVAAEKLLDAAAMKEAGVKQVTVPGAQAREAMLGMGVGESIADLLIEMYGAIDSGALETKEPRTPETTTPT